MLCWKSMLLHQEFNFVKLNCSIRFSTHTLIVSKNIDHSFRHLVWFAILSRWYNINPNSFTEWNGRCARRLSWFAALLLPLIWLQLLLSLLVLLSLHRNLQNYECCAWRNCSHNEWVPKEILTQDWELSSFTDGIRTSTPNLKCWKVVVTSKIGPILVVPWIHPFASEAGSSRGNVYSRQANWFQKKFTSISCHEILSNFYQNS